MTLRDRRHLWTAIAIALVMVVAGACSKKKSAEREDAGDQAAPVEEAPPIVVAMTQAHGGMVGWRTTRAISFTADVTGGAADSSAATLQAVIDPAKGRMYADVPGTGERMGWDGERVWSLNWTLPWSPRFIAELDYYLLNLPWLAMDPAANLTVADRDTLFGDPTEYSVVRMRPAAQGGLPPGTYRLYIDPESKQLRACRFSGAPAGTTQELVLVYENYSKADGMVLPSQATVYAGDYTPVMVLTFRDWKLDTAFDAGRAAAPDSAAVN